MVVRVVIAEDHAIMRDGLRSLLGQQKGIELVGEAEHGLKVLPLVRKTTPDIVIMDIAMPGLNGIELTRKILAEAASVKVIALSMLSELRWVTAMLRAGARGYLLKSECTVQELAQCIRTVREGNMYLSAGIMGPVVKDYIQNLGQGNGSRYSLLSAREREVFQLLAEGLTAREIAAALNLSRKTVETHRRRIMQKLELKTINQLIRYAITEGIPTGTMHTTTFNP